MNINWGPNWEGEDADLDISLNEYGVVYNNKTRLMVCKVDLWFADEHLTSYETVNMTKKEAIQIVRDLGDVDGENVMCDFTGETWEEITSKPWWQILSDAISCWGPINVLGVPNGTGMNEQMIKILES